MQLLQVTGLSKHALDHAPLSNIHFSLDTGRVAALIGHSNEAITNLFQCLSGLEKPDSGTITIGAHTTLQNGISTPLPPGTAGGIGMVMQDLQLFPHLTVEQNLLLPLCHVLHQTRAQASSNVHTLLEFCTLSDRATHLPQALTHEEQLCAALARALVLDPAVLLIDHPFSHPVSLDRICDLFHQLTARGISLMISTANLLFAQKFSDSILFMDENTIVEESTPGEFFAVPRSLAGRRFILDSQGTHSFKSYVP